MNFFFFLNIFPAFYSDVKDSMHHCLIWRRDCHQTKLIPLPPSRITTGLKDSSSTGQCITFGVLKAQFSAHVLHKKVITLGTIKRRSMDWNEEYVADKSFVCLQQNIMVIYFQISTTIIIL